jgi:hypothetical protein
LFGSGNSTMRRKHFYLCFVLCMIGVSVFWFVQGRSPIDKATYDAIVLGMPEDEAMKLVPISHRAPGAGKNRSGSSQLLAEAGTAHFKSDEVFNKEMADGTFVYFEVATNRELAKVRFWDTDDYSLVVLFSPDGKVMGKTIYRFVSTDDPWWDSLRRSLKL